MSDFPPRDYLAHVARAISRRLTEDCAYLLGTEHFAEEAALLERLRRPEHLAQGVEAMQPAEAARLAERLLARWGRIGEVELEPAVAIVCPEELWFSDRPRSLRLQLATLGIDEDFQIQWMGDVQQLPDATGWASTLAPPTGEAPAEVVFGVRVIGRNEDRRCVLTAQRRVRLRRIVVQFDKDGRRIHLSDQSGQAGGGVSVVAGDWSGRTAQDGSCELPDDLPLPSTLMFDGEAEVAVSPAMLDEPGQPAG